MKIEVNKEHIPVTAVDADNYEPGMPVGSGATEQEAIADLLEQVGREQP